MEAKRARNKGEIVDTPPKPVGIGASDSASSLRLFGAFERWRKEHRGPEKSAVEFESVIRRFISLHGDLMVAEITKAHVREFKDALLDYPARLSNTMRKLSVRDVLALHKDKPDIPRLKPVTINEKYLTALSVVLKKAVTEGFIEFNPAADIKATEDRNAEPTRIPYTDEDIAKIISWSIFSEGERPEAGKGVASVWMPLISMYSGARLEEIARLTRESFGTEDGVLFFRIQGRPKNPGSRRKVPVHSKLVALGFMDYVESIASGYIFPNLEEVNGKRSHSWSKWYGRYSRARGITDKRKVFHSFRHTVKRKLRNLPALDPTLFDAVMGHVTQTASARYGLDQEGQGFALRNLQIPIEALRYPEVEQATLILV